MLATSRKLLKTRATPAVTSLWARQYHYNKGTAKDMMEKSCYHGVNFVISEDATVFDAITRMAGINLGCLAVSGADGRFVGVVTERDYLKKVELQNLTARNTKVSQIMTKRSRVIVAKAKETPSQLMTKMLSSVSFITSVYFVYYFQ
jgi:CBS-domain-containing membrane protein